MRWVFIFTCLGIIVLAVVGIVSAQTPPTCPDAPTQRLIVGKQGSVIRRSDQHLRLEPKSDSDELGTFPQESVFFVHSGPACAEGFAWWYVDFEGVFGWMAEGDSATYWVEPIGDSLQDLPERTAALDEVITSRYEDVQIEFALAVAEDAEGETVPEVTESAPDYTLFQFEGYRVSGDLAPELRVYPLEAFEQVTGESLESLKNLLEARPETANVAYAPVIDAMLIFALRPTYIDFRGGSGIRYVAHWMDSPSPVIDGEIYYVFTGLTDDGTTFIQAIFPLASALLPDDSVTTQAGFNEETFIINYGGYLITIADVLTDAPRASFVPNLGALDELIGSLQFGEVEIVEATSEVEETQPATRESEATNSPATTVAQAPTRESAAAAPSETPAPTPTAAPVTSNVNCTLMPFSDTNVRVIPDLGATAPGYVPGGASVRADGQRQRVGEDFNWWRLVSDAPITFYPGYNASAAYWIRADFVHEEGDCGSLPVIPN